MEELFSAKQPGAWLWTVKLTRAEVLARLEDGRLRPEWLVCPLGCPEHAVTVEVFTADPAVFLRLRRQDAQRQRDRQAAATAVERPWLFRAGQGLLTCFLICLMVGGATVKIFFPEMQGAGLTPVALMVLIPIWSIGGLGLLALALGWLQYRYRVRVAIRRHDAFTTEATGPGSGREPSRS